MVLVSHTCNASDLPKFNNLKVAMISLDLSASSYLCHHPPPTALSTIPLGQQPSQEPLPTRAPKLARAHKTPLLYLCSAKVSPPLPTSSLRTPTHSTKVSASSIRPLPSRCDSIPAAFDDVIPRWLEPPHPPPHTPHKSTHLAIPEESRAERLNHDLPLDRHLRQLASLKPPDHPFLLSLHLPKHACLQVPNPPIPVTLALTQIILVFSSKIVQQGSQESVTSVESLPLSAQQRRRSRFKSHQTNGLPAYYQSHNRIHEVRQSRASLFLRSQSEPDTFGTAQSY